MIRSAPALLLMLAACTSDGLAASGAAPDTLSITAANEGEGCSLVVGGRQLTSAQFAELAEAWPRRRVAEVILAPQTRYRCVGGVIFTLQRLGFEIRVIDSDTGYRIPLARPR